MRTVIAFVVMALVLFGLAAGASIFLTNYLKEQGKSHSEASAGDKDSGKELPPLARGTEGAARSRPSPTPESEQVVQEWAKLREREQAVIRLERKVTHRQKFLDTIKDDIRSECEEIDKLRKDVADQVKGAAEELASAERRVQDLEAKQKVEEAMLKDVKSKVYEADTVRRDNLKRVGGIADTAEPAEVAAIFERMAEGGAQGLMTAAQLLANMKDRRAAQVLQAIQDKRLAADLLEKMIGLKQAAVPPGASRVGGGRPERVPAPTPNGSK
jgi:hypothetical protein